MNAGGGLLVGTVIKYADAVTKDVAIGASIVLSSVASTQLFGFEISEMFVVGVTMVRPLFAHHVSFYLRLLE